ncbi:hypothetical protein [uncultured Planktosalinus sp.]|uniref:hypothetical protein n=1 Tax=uncultured Planktosalinus sp. TaxID=1810935 RepID=UPI0030D81497
MKTMKLMITTVFVAFISISMLTAQNNESILLSVSEITVKQGHNAQFMEGVKKWKECYLENDGKESWNIWRRVQGEGTVYIMASVMANWAEMDIVDPVNKDCYTTVLNFIMPHVEKVNYNIARSMPEFSRDMPEDTKLVWVTFFKVNDGTAFREIISAVSSSIKAKEGITRGIWYDYMGGALDAADYMVSTPYSGFAQMDIKRDSPWKIYENAVGKKKADEMGKKWDAAVDAAWSHIYTLNTELSNQ